MYYKINSSGSFRLAEEKEQSENYELAECKTTKEYFRT